MLKRENRLKKNRHFNYIYKKGQGVSLDDMTVVYIKAKVKPFKVGFSVSNKVGKAVVRNKAKRRMRESFAQIMSQVDRRYNYIFVAKPSIADKTFIDIKNNMLLVLKKAGMLNEDIKKDN